MHRIEDYYNWTILRHWKYVIDKGCVKWKVVQEEEIEDAVLDRALQALVHDCFPFAIVCCCMEDEGKVIWALPIWAAIIRFLNGERNIRTEKGIVSFEDMDTDKRCAILNAHVLAVWMKEDNMDNT